MKRQGAEIVDNVKVSEIDEIPVAKFFCNRFKTDINAYLAKRTPAPPVKSLEEILASGIFHPSKNGGSTPRPRRHPMITRNARRRRTTASGLRPGCCRRWTRPS